MWRNSKKKSNLPDEEDLVIIKKII
jgi:hypothetical protein